MLELISTPSGFQVEIRADLSISYFKKFNILVLLKKDKYIDKLGKNGKNHKKD